MDLCATALEKDFVHEQVDEIDSAPVFGVDVFALEQAGQPRGIKSFAFILNDDENSPVCLTGATDASLLARILTIP